MMMNVDFRQRMEPAYWAQRRRSRGILGKIVCSLDYYKLRLYFVCKQSNEYTTTSWRGARRVRRPTF